MVDPRSVLATTRLELTRFPTLLHDLLGDLDPTAWRTRPAVAEWSPVEIICHLRDEEAEDFSARVRVVVEGGDRFVPIDPERWAEERRYREDDPRDAMNAFRERRVASLTFLEKIDPARLTAVVERTQGEPLSGLDLLVAWVTHDRLHLTQLAGTLARLWADRWSPLRAEYAGSIPYAPAAR